MDFNELYESLKDKFPIFASVTSIIFGLASFVVNFHQLSTALAISGISICGGFGLTIGFYAMVKKSTLDKSNSDYKLLLSEDFLQISDANGSLALYEKTIKVKLKNDLQMFYIFLPENSGTAYNYRAYKLTDISNKTSLDCSKEKYIGRAVLAVKKPFKKNDEITFLFSWNLKNSFKSNEESISVKAEPNQQCCKLKITGYEVFRPTWSMSYGDNPKNFSEGALAVVHHEGLDYVEQDFTPLLGKRGYKCTLAWSKSEA